VGVNRRRSRRIGGRKEGRKEGRKKKKEEWRITKIGSQGFPVMSGVFFIFHDSSVRARETCHFNTTHRYGTVSYSTERRYVF